MWRVAWTWIIAMVVLAACTRAAKLDVPSSSEPALRERAATRRDPAFITEPDVMASAPALSAAPEQAEPPASASPRVVSPKDFVCWEGADHVLRYPGGGCMPIDPVCPCTRVVSARRKSGVPR